MCQVQEDNEDRPLAETPERMQGAEKEGLEEIAEKSQGRHHNDTPRHPNKPEDEDTPRHPDKPEDEDTPRHPDEHPNRHPEEEETEELARGTTEHG